MADMSIGVREDRLGDAYKDERQNKRHSLLLEKPQFHKSPVIVASERTVAGADEPTLGSGTMDLPAGIPYCGVQNV
jgi:hypothetical protein